MGVRLRAVRLTTILKLFLGLAVIAAATEGAQSTRARIRSFPDRIEFPAEVQAKSFERTLLGFGMPGYHYIVWSEGEAIGAALFRSRVSDRDVIAALQGIGLAPGNALNMKTWDERNDEHSKAPDRLIEGPPVEVLVRVPSSNALLGIGEILTDPAKRGFDMRFGGHAGNIHLSHSGCLVCLYSCPGSKIGNRAYTVRDYTKKRATFRLRAGVLPADGTEVTIVVRKLSSKR